MKNNDNWIEGKLGYNHKNERYGLLISDLWKNDGFHCGDSLQIKIDDIWLDTSFEMDWSDGTGVWYLTNTDIRGNAIENIIARIKR